MLPDGTINLPRVGTIYIKDLSINEARDLISKAYSSILRNPEVFVDLISSRPVLISISGEVQQPGIYSLDLTRVSTIRNSDDGEGSIVRSTGWPTIIDAIQKAGGLTSNADIRSIKVRRFNKGSIASTRIVNLSNLFEGSNTERLEPIFDGDSINVSKAEVLSTERSFKLSRSNIAPSKITVNVIGEVLKPGEIKIPANTSLSQAILLAGGPLDLRSNLGSVELLRVNENGSLQLKKYRINFSNDVNQLKNPLLKSGDLLRVRKSFVAKGSDTVETIAKPISGVITTWSLFKLISP